jgi:outer membrane receptor protein involved in Fe transport
MGFQSVFRSGRFAAPLALAGLMATVGHAPTVFAAAAGVEEITVTAQRTEESIQDVPIAVSAFTGTMLEDKQIISPSDLQMNSPNVSFSATNFGASSFSIRGIGRLAIAATADAGVSIHLNELSMPTNLPATEFYDLERVEVLRGPQGTLFGKNATGGVVNIVTAKPSVDAVSGDVDVEYGSYSNERAKATLNIPITDTFAIRAAGMRLSRDGYTENTANGQIGCTNGTGPDYGTPCTATTLTGIDGDMDGRDLYTYRITALWNITENATGWLMYGKFYENDDKTRVTSQVCQQNPLPVQGCLPDGYGFDAPNAGTGTAGIFFGLNGAVLMGDPDPPNGFPSTSGGLRESHTDFEPVYKYNEDLFQANYQYTFDKYTVVLQGGYETYTYLSQQDYAINVGSNLAAIPAVPPPLITVAPGVQVPLLGAARPAISSFPTSAAAGQSPSSDWTSDQCNFLDGTAGIFGGCVYPANQTRAFSFDQSDQDADYWTVESRIQSSYDGKLNFMIGGNYSETSLNGDYYVMSNALDVGGLYGTPAIGFPALYPSMFDATGAPNGGAYADSKSVFGELYFQLTEAIKITAGLRYNDDTKGVSESGVLFNSYNTCQTPAGSLIGGCYAAPVFMRSGVFTPLASLTAVDADGLPTAAPGTAAFFSTANGVAIMNYYGLYDEYLAAHNATVALTPGTGAWAASYGTMLNTIAGVPLVPTYNETRNVTNSPTKADWQATTGRIGVDWRVFDDAMVYAFFTHGYKPGGFNPALNAEFLFTSPGVQQLFDEEEVDSYEIGTKSSFLDGGLVVNSAVFYYDYTGLQLATIQNNTAINSNVDASIYGFELETSYIPEFLPKLQMDVSYSYLSTTIDNYSGIDPLNRTGGDPNWIQLNNIDPGSLTGVNYAARIGGGSGATGDLAITPTIVQNAYAACQAMASAADGNTNVTCTPPGSTPRPVVPVANGTVYPNGVPSYLSRGYLKANGVAVAEGLPIDLDGNELPQSPENKVHVGAAYTIATSFGSFTPRVDYYWQSESYAREFNTKGDYIDSWDQWNASVLYESVDGRWEARAWIRNIGDEDNVTGKYLTSDTSGFFRNYFLTEPRIYGASFTYNFGALE